MLMHNYIHISPHLSMCMSMQYTTSTQSYQHCLVPTLPYGHTFLCWPAPLQCQHCFVATLFLWPHHFWPRYFFSIWCQDHIWCQHSFGYRTHAHMHCTCTHALHMYFTRTAHASTRIRTRTARTACTGRTARPHTRTRVAGRAVRVQPIEGSHHRIQLYHH